MSARVAVVLGLLAITAPITAVTDADDCLDVVGRAPQGTAEAVVTQGVLAYMGNGAELMIVDLSDPSAPVVLGTLDLPYLLYELAVAGNRVYAATARHLHVIDVTAPASPVELGLMETDDIRNRTMSASGDVVCFFDYSGQLVVVDVSDPAAPVVAGQWYGGVENDVEMVGNHAFVTAGGSLHVLDLTDPGTPTQVGSLADVAGNLAVEGSLLYAASDSFKIIDIATPAAPVLVGSSASLGGIDVAVRDGLAFLKNSGNGIDVVEVSNPASPTWTGLWSWNGGFMEVAAISGHALSATSNQGVRVVDATNPASPFETSAIDSPGETVAVARGDGFFALAHPFRGLRTMDMTDPLNPTELAVLDPDPISVVLDVDIVGDVAYVAGGRFTVVDVSDPGSLVVIGEISSLPGSGEAVKVVGDYAYVVTTSFGLRVVDVSDPAAPVVIGNLDLGHHDWRYLDVAGSLVALGGGPTTKLIDVSDPSSPFVVASIDRITYSRSIAFYRSWLLIGAANSFWVYDVSDPANPVEVAEQFRPRAVSAIGVAGSVAYVGGLYGGAVDSEIEAWDLRDPLHPVLIGIHNQAGDVTDFAFSDEYLFTSRHYSGADVFTLCQDPLFADGFETGDTQMWSTVNTTNSGWGGR